MPADETTSQQGTLAWIFPVTIYSQGIDSQGQFWYLSPVKRSREPEILRGEKTVAKIETPKASDILSSLPPDILASIRASIEAEILQTRADAFSGSAKSREAEAAADDLRKVDSMIFRAEEIISTLKKGRKAGKDAAVLCGVAKLFSSVGQSAYLFLNPPVRSGGARGRKGSALPVW